MYDMKNLTKLKKLGELAPEAFKGFMAFDEAVFKGGAIPLKYKELIAVSVVPAHVGNTSLRVTLEVTRGREPLAGGELRYVFVDLHTTRKCPIPQEVRAALVRAVPEGVQLRGRNPLTDRG